MERFINNKYEWVIQNDYAGFVERIRREIDEKGMSVLESFVAPDFLAELQASVEELTPACYQNGKRKHLVGSDLQNTGFWEVTFSEFVLKLANDILQAFHVQLEPADIHPVMNILTGDQGQDTVRAWHFDATYLTIAMPVVMPPPTGERDGKFRIWPNVRPFSQNKLQHKLYCNLAKTGAFQKMARNYAVNFVPGSLYFFYGFRSLHGTDELDSRQVRANCLMNFGGPFFDLQTSLNIADQETIETILPLARRREMGVIAKRPLANALWRHSERPENSYHHVYWDRLQALRYEFLADPQQALECALRFPLSVPGVHTIIVGTTKPENWGKNARYAAAGPLEPERFAAIRSRWQEVAQPEWVGQQ